MKGKIDGTGQLSIKRAGQWISCVCKRGGMGAHEWNNPCSHSCPHFKEPEAESESVFNGLERTSTLTGRTIVRICEGTVWTFDEFKDGRGGA